MGFRIEVDDALLKGMFMRGREGGIVRPRRLRTDVKPGMESGELGNSSS